MRSVLWCSRAGPESPRLAGWRYAAAMLALLVAGAGAAMAKDEIPGGVTPPRVSLAEGEVSFWRPGQPDWEPVRVNIPLAPGDALATSDGKIEVQVGGSSFVRVGRESRVQLKSLEPDFLQLEVSEGQTTIDLRDLPRGHVVEVDTPGTVVTVVRDGYYRFDVSGDATRVVARRGGRASVTPAGGHETQVATGEAMIVEGVQQALVSTVAAPDLDDWDRWNYARADRYLASLPSRSLPPEVYGTDELERHGSWRVVETYGRVWVPYAAPVGWVPYSTGIWLRDPYWGWTWVDDAPWGWAPFHYGRWVYTSGYWAWAPGPVFVTPVYAPALVAFFGGGGFSIGVSVPFVSWVALGWGEPLVPWWGPVGFYGVPCWRGWGGPRTVVIKNYNTIIVNKGADLYRNTKVPNAIVGVPKDKFDASPIARYRLSGLGARDVKPAPDLAGLSRGAALPTADKGPARRVPDFKTRVEARGEPAGKPAGPAPVSIERGHEAAPPPAKPAANPSVFDRMENKRLPPAARGLGGGEKAPAVPERSILRGTQPPPGPPKGDLRRLPERNTTTEPARLKPGGGSPKQPNEPTSKPVGRSVDAWRSRSRDTEPPPRLSKPDVRTAPARRPADAWRSYPGGTGSPSQPSRAVDTSRAPARSEMPPPKPRAPANDLRRVMRERAARPEPGPVGVLQAPVPEQRSVGRGSGSRPRPAPLRSVAPRSLERAVPSAAPAKRGLALSLPSRGPAAGGKK